MSTLQKGPISAGVDEKYEDLWERLFSAWMFVCGLVFGGVCAVLLHQQWWDPVAVGLGILAYHVVRFAWGLRRLVR
jgi:CHASE2 domain-containing sensor protein